MFLTCSHPFPGALASSVLDLGKSLEELEKKVRTKRVKLENRVETDYQILQGENRELKEQVRWNEWALFGMMTHMEQMEMRMDLLHNQVTTVAPAPVVDLTREESEGGVGGPLELGSPIGLRSPSPLHLDDVMAEALEALGRNWEMLNRGDVSTSGEYTPTGPWYQNPEL